MSKTFAWELVDDAYADTWTGDLPWDPSQCALLEHFCRAIKHRTWLEIRHRRRIPLVSLDAPPTDAATSQQLEHALAWATQGERKPLDLDAISAMVCQELRHLVLNDPEAALLLRCWEAGHIDRNKARARSKLSKRAYEGARKRLLYLCRYLTPALRKSAQDCLGGAA